MTARARCPARRRSGSGSAHHRRLAVEHALVHVDVDHLRAVLDLLARATAERVVVVGLRGSCGRRPEPVTLVRSPTFTNSDSGRR